MRKQAKLLAVLPESYIIVLVLLAGFSPPFSIHPLLLIFVALLVLQLIFRNVITGFMLAGLFVTGNLYMFLAMLSELSEFPAFNWSAARLLIAGSLIILVNLFIAGLMFFNYHRKL